MPEVEQHAEAIESPPSKNGRFLTAAVVFGVMLLEGGGIFFAVRMLYKQPEMVKGAETGEGEDLAALEREVEIPLPELNAFNKREGRLMLYNLEVAVRVKRSEELIVRKVLEAREATILDRLNTVIRGADVKYLNEAGLETLRRQFRFELGKVVGNEELVLEILVRKFFQSPADV
jgi:flagellar basal body-associated protein FliL